MILHPMVRGYTADEWNQRFVIKTDQAKEVASAWLCVSLSHMPHLRYLHLNGCWNLGEKALGLIDAFPNAFLNYITCHG